MKKNEIFTAFFIAKKNITRNRSALFFTILIISLGFISSIIIYGVLQNVSYNMQENFIETTMGHIILEPYGEQDKIENVDNIIKKIKTLPNVLGIAKITKKAARLYDSENEYVDTPLYIINPEEFSEFSVVDEIIKEGNWLNRGEKDKIFMGCINIKNCNENKAFDTINLDVGERVRAVINGYQEMELTLQGIYNHNYMDVEVISYIGEETAKKYFDDYDPSTADQIVLRLPDRSYSEDVVEQLSIMQINADILTWEDKSSRWSSVVDSFGIIGNISFFIGLLISAISIYVILYINILNKKTQIGIIKAIGIKSRVIALSYVILSFFLGVVGSITGVLLTLSMIKYFEFNPIKTGIGNLVPQVTLSIFLLVSFAIILASIISGYIVSKKITKQNIIEAIFNG
jgi:putative ABC transport system permease protein